VKIEGQIWYNPKEPLDFHAILIINGKAYTQVDNPNLFGDPQTLQELSASDMNSYLSSLGFERIGDGTISVTQSQQDSVGTYLDQYASLYAWNGTAEVYTGGQQPGLLGPYTNTTDGWDQFPTAFNCVGPFQAAFAQAGIDIYTGGSGIIPPQDSQD